MPQTIKASVSYGLNQGFSEPEDVVIDDPKGAEVLVDIKGSGLCHSDLHVVDDGNALGFSFPMILGHEVSGVVEAVGPFVSGLKVGDRVVASLEQVCGHCANCLNGHPEVCTQPQECVRGADETPRLSFPDGRPIYQGWGIGGFAEKALIHENQLAVINDQVPWDQAACLGCATITGAGAAINTAHVRPGDTVAVVGTGGVGLNVISGARIAGASKIIAIDILDNKLEFARKFGATDVVNSKKEDPVAKVRELTNGGVDKSFEVIGFPATVKQAWDMLGMHGTTYCIGMSNPGSKLTIDVDTASILVPEKGLRGVSMGSTNIKHDLPMYADFVVDGRLNMKDLISQNINLGQINQGYDQLQKGEVIRSVITEF
ncbi:alcohol dehydrogenase catalytic domain-containing protein [Bifidobacterium sp. ESL0732]|uniref:zinc-binding dehydrogenase n=1 Tax=Bifidobacterium sp. ESL0732 TaxID=2983222 RepID=UPI0023F7D9B0|nr:alcohol dehydrogenase catalytic domain-containing protein [Bifidobacterium sp. ESL0732]WEV63701.1 alcohol dehydrogenase catalytic domain-containing protein [Bifidobacterium sp. ESL0732]